MEVWKHLAESVVASAAVDNVGVVMSFLHDFLPGFVDVREPLCLLWQLLGNVSASENCLQIDPEVLNNQPILNDLHRHSQLRHPFLDFWFEWSVVPDDRHGMFNYNRFQLLTGRIII